MHVFLVTIPGRRLDAQDQAWASGVAWLLGLLETQFLDASVALNLFDEENTRPAERDLSHRMAEDEAESELEEELRRREQEVGSDRFWKGYATIQQDAARTVVLRRWKRGEWPEEFERRKSFLHAHSFVFAVDGFVRTFRVLADTLGAPAVLADVASRLQGALPDLKGVRDSAAHLEDRGRGLDKREQPLDLKPVDNSLIKAPGRVLGLSNLNGSKLGYTTEAGEYGEVDVSAMTLTFVGDAFQDAVNAFPWRGASRTIPHTA